MNQETTTQLPFAAKFLPWIGVGLTSLVVLFMIFDGVTKVARVKPVMEACEKMNISPEMAVGIGILLLVCTAIYVMPQTSVLGAVLLTGYLGGGVALQLANRSGTFPTVFPAAFGMLVWAGLVLREPRVLAWMFLRL